MVTQAWHGENQLRDKDKNSSPIVTIFGAGVAGLSLAHELVERGFAVQVVEREVDPDEEYECLVGGMAANQYARAPADAARVHAYLYDEPPDVDETIDPYVRGVYVAVLKPDLKPVVCVHIGEQICKVNPAGNGTGDIAREIVDAIVKENLPGITASIPDPTRPNEFLIQSTDTRKVPAVWIGVIPASAKDGKEEPVDRDRALVEDLHALGELRAVELRCAQPRIPFPERLQFERPGTGAAPPDWHATEDERGVPNSEKLEMLYARLVSAYRLYSKDLASQLLAHDVNLSDRMLWREELFVELRGYTDGDGEVGNDRALALEWTKLVLAWLVQRDADEEAKNDPDQHPNIPWLEQRIVLVPVGGGELLGSPHNARARYRSNRVELRIVENRIPGEHGYRFFPRFYRHLFDTMKRTPILDKDGKETGDTAFDQLVDTESVDLALRDKRNPYEVPVRRPRSLEEMRKLLRIHFDTTRPEVRGLRITQRDAIRFQLRLLQFLTSSRQRREEYEEKTWWEFVGGDSGAGYSPDMARILKEMPQALLAMNAEETDARSQGVIYTQLLLDSLGDGRDCNKTLNGPTSEVWLKHWKRYLKRQGVRFFVGELSRLFWAKDKAGESVLLPWVTQPTSVGSSVTYAAITAADGSVWLSVNDEVFVSEMPNWPAIVEDLATKVNLEAQRNGAFGVEATWELARLGILSLHPIFKSGAKFLHIRGNNNSPARLSVNGLPLGDGDIRINAADFARLLNDFAALLVAEVVGDARAPRQTILVAPPDGMVILSVLSDEPGEYRVEIHGRSVRFWNDAREGLERIRDALLAGIQALDVDATPFGATGILLPDAGVSISPGGRPARLGLGVDMRVVDPLRNEDLDVQRADLLSVRALYGAGVVGAISEDRSLDYLSQSVTLDDEGETVLALSEGGGPDFYVLALPLERASELVWDAHLETLANDAELEGCLDQLLEFDVRTKRRADSDPNSGAILLLQRDGNGRPVPAEYPLRDLSGIQFYFDHHVRIGAGHSYFPHAAYGLSSISQLAYWRERMAEKSAFLGQLSVDIGSWYTPIREFDANGDSDESRAPKQQSAWRSTRDAIATSVWEQIMEGVNKDKAKKIVCPRYYHLDRGIRFADGDLQEFASGVRLVIVDPHVKLRVADELIDLQPADPASLAEEIEDETGHIALALANQSVWIAPLAKYQSSVLVFVIPDGVDTVYRVRIAGTTAEVQSASAQASEVRDALIQQIHATVPGAIASVASDCALRVTLASADRTVSALAHDPASNEPNAKLVLDPSGSVRVVPEAGVEIGNPADATPARNATMFLINGPKVWRSRPGLFDQRWQDTPLLFPDEPDEPGREAPKPDVIYHPSNKRWLMVGNLMATHTRLSTMESANESARHAVIAMLRAVSADLDDENSPDYNGQGNLLADFPKLWNPEQHELDDTEPLKRLDEQLHASGIPHFLEILRVPDWIDALPEDFDLKSLPEGLAKLVKTGIETVEKDWGFTQLDELGSAARAAIQKLIGL